MTADAAWRGLLLHQRDHRIAELELELPDVRKKQSLDPQRRRILRTLHDFLTGIRYCKTPIWHNAAFFLVSGLCIGLWFLYSALMGMLFYGGHDELGRRMGLLWGLLMGSLSLNAHAWLLTADVARLGILLHECDRRIVELELELPDVRKKQNLDP